MSKNKTIELGDSAKDIITGFSGVVIGKCEYLTGCDQYALQPKTEKNGTYQDSRWFDSSRLKLLKKKIVDLTEKIKADKPGADFSPPSC